MRTGEVIAARLAQMQKKPSDLAAAVGVSSTAVGYWISGHTAPNRSRQEKVANYLVISVSQLMGTAPLEHAKGELSEHAKRVAAMFDSMSPLRQKTAYALMVNLADESAPLPAITKEAEMPPAAPRPKQRPRM